MAYVGEVLKKDYYKILNGQQLGDLVFLTTENDTVIHAAAYLADDLVFTKNGVSHTQPWILMHQDDMVETYAVRIDSLLERINSRRTTNRRSVETTAATVR